MARKGNTQHKEDRTNELHPRGIDSDGCLNRHVSAYREGKKCSHRFQAYKKAKEDSSLYDFPAYEALCARERRTSYPGVVRRPGGGMELKMCPRPEKGDWDLGASRNGVPNFRRSADVPYYHNAHHIIPNGTLSASIHEACGGDPRAKTALRQALYEAKYNLNDRINMAILPMCKVVGWALGLPRHISGIQVPFGAPREMQSHQAYSLDIQQKVDAVLKGFASSFDKQDHSFDAEAARQQLERISTITYRRLKSWGKKASGSALVDAPAWVIRSTIF